MNKICGPSYYVPGDNVRCLNDEIIELSYGELKDSRDGQIYKTIRIGDQTWMAENLNYRYVGVKYLFNDGYKISESDSTSWCYKDEPSNCEKYGRLYTWSAVMDSAAQFSTNARTECGYGKLCTPNSPHRGICPVGWHVPANEEYHTLYTYVGGISIAGKLLKSISDWNGADSYGFSLLPAEERDSDGAFRKYSETSLWTTDEDNKDSRYVWLQSFIDRDGAYEGGSYKSKGYSLRCLKD
ncbi:MAG: fibrobacter succinogenes major paralogous domain-containing protein [Fibrobacter sp.]|nr:fibrobacter succinogenes major paralogous domain-containing protein [Fibrobacter sp.]